MTDIEDYDNASAWQDLIREQQMKMSEIFGISGEKLMHWRVKCKPSCFDY